MPPPSIFTVEALAVIRDHYSRGMDKTSSPLFSACMTRVQELMGEAAPSVKQLRTWINNQNSAQKRQQITTPSAAMEGTDGTIGGTDGDEVPLPADQIGEDPQVAEAQPGNSAPQARRSAGKVTKSSAVTRRAPGKRTGWHVLLQKAGEEVRGSVHQKDIGTIARLASQKKDEMSAEEWEELRLEAEQQNENREFEEGREYTEAEKHLLIQHYTSIFNKTALTLGKLGVSMVGTQIASGNEARPTTFHAGPFGEQALRLMEDQNLHMWRFLTTASWGTAPPQARTVEQTRGAVRLALLNKLNEHRAAMHFAPQTQFPSAELERGCPTKTINWPVGVPYTSKFWDKDGLEALKGRLSAMGSVFGGPEICFSRCPGCQRCGQLNEQDGQGPAH